MLSPNVVIHLTDDIILIFALLFKYCPKVHLLDVVIFRCSRNLQKLREIGVLSILHASLLDLLCGQKGINKCILCSARDLLYSLFSSVYRYAHAFR